MTTTSVQAIKLSLGHYRFFKRAVYNFQTGIFVQKKSHAQVDKTWPSWLTLFMKEYLQCKLQLLVMWSNLEIVCSEDKLGIGHAQVLQILSCDITFLLKRGWEFQNLIKSFHVVLKVKLTCRLKFHKAEYTSLDALPPQTQILKLNMVRNTVKIVSRHISLIKD